MQGSPKILMCRPDHFNVSYSINPWMESNINNSQKDLASSQWKTLVENIDQVSDLEFIEPVAGSPDLVFTANAGLVFKDKVILSNFKFAERQAEKEINEKWFRSQGFETVSLPDEVHFEGAGDALFDRKTKRLWVAYGFRSDQEAYPLIQSILDVPVLQLELVNPQFYHLDTCFCPLSKGHILYYPGAFSEESNKLIQEQVDPELLIEVDGPDADNFVCNAVSIEGSIFTTLMSSELQFKLESLGYRVAMSNLSEFQKSGGASKCLTLRLDEH